MVKTSVDFDEVDAKLLTWLVTQFNRHGEAFKEEDLSKALAIDRSLARDRLVRFMRFQMISSVSRGGLWKIEPQLLSVAEQLSTPEAPTDRIEDAKKWFRGQWWSVPLWFVFTVIPLVLLPALLGWFAILRWCFGQVSK